MADRPDTLSAPDPHASEEMRDLVQKRLALLGFTTFLLSFGFLVLATAGDLALSGLGPTLERLAEPRRTLNLAGAAVSALVWLVARTGTRTPGQLLVVDGVGTIGAVVPYTLMSVLGQEGIAGVLMTALTVMLVLQTRALMVPSDARRTLYISLVAALLSIVLTGIAHEFWPERRAAFDLARLFINLVLWLSVIVATSTVASWVLFGLRQQIRAARRLGQYILGEKIGEGGMGVVYRAEHSLLRRRTAIKLLPPDHGGESARRFEREVQLTASLQHPNTVTVYDYGRTRDGLFYYVMEYLDGGDLQSVVDVGGPMPPARVVHILRQIASGLAEAHEIGLIHRDIKPANVLLAGAGPVADLAKVVDFGLVRARKDDEASSITQTGHLVGTPHYMAPEAIADPDGVDARADIYALGAVGYFLLTGATVFPGRTIVEICSHHLHTEPEPPSGRAGGLPEMLVEVVMTCLRKDREDRPDAHHLVELLDACDDVGQWSHGDARAWWTAHGADLASGRSGPEVSGVGPTLAVEIAQR